MAFKLVRSFLFILNVLVVFGELSITNSDSEDNLSCEDTCTISYSPHTSPYGNENDACQRGCRFYAISRFITEDDKVDEKSELTPANDLCHKSCKDSYNETSRETNACINGCDGEELSFLQTKKETPPEDEEEFNSPILRKVMEIREITSQVIGMLRVIQSSLTVYFVGEDNKMIAVQGPVEVMVEMNDDGYNMLENESQELDNDIPDSEPQQQYVMKEKIRNIYDSTDSSIQCLSRRLGVPPYLLMVSLISIIIFFTYVLFIICSSPNKKAKQTEISKVLPPHALPVKLVRTEDLTKLSLMDEDDNQAPPLPSKVKLPDNTII